MPEESKQFIWLDSGETLRRYLFAQCFGNIVGQAYLFQLQANTQVDIGKLVDFALQSADAAASRIEQASDSPPR